MAIRTIVLAATLATAFAATPAAAATLFRLFGDTNGDFTLPTPVVTSAATADYFAIYGTPGSLDSVGSFFDIFFYLDLSGGGFDIQDTLNPDNLLQLGGPVLFNGPTSAPRFLNGRYELTDYNGDGGSYTLTISTIPEPASWALLIAGFGLTGAAMRRRRRVPA